MQNRKKQRMVIASLCAVIIGMVVGYAALSQILNISGISKINGDFNIEFTKIDENTMVSSKTVTKGGIGTTTANFTVDLEKPGASAIYDLTVENKGSIDAVLKSIEGIDESNLSEPLDVKFSLIGINEGDFLNVGASKTFQVKVVWDSSATTIPSKSKNLVLKLNYEQKVGTTPHIMTYNVGDEIYFDPTTGTTCSMGEEWTQSNTGSTCYKWNVIKDNGDSYDMLLDHNISETQWASSDDEADQAPANILSHISYLPSYWVGIEPLTSADNVTRPNAIGNYTINYEGYKARLISVQELVELGNIASWSPTEAKSYELPSWLTANGAYWTDSAYEGFRSIAWYVNDERKLSTQRYNGEYGVRPVVKILKSNI